MNRHGLFILLAALFSAALPGVRPALAETVYLPAEEFASPDEAWRAKSHFKAWYTGRLDGRMLFGNAGTKGEAGQIAEVEEGSEYRLWLRYLAVNKYRGPFEVSVSPGAEARRLAPATCYPLRLLLISVHH